MGKTVKRKIRKASKFKQTVEFLKEWKEVIAIIVGVGSIIYTITSYKVNLENKVDSKMSEQEVRTLIQMENQDLKDDVKTIKRILMEWK